MLLALLTVAHAAPCVWEAEDLLWIWSGELTLTSEGGAPILELREGTYDAVRVEVPGWGPTQLRVTTGAVTLWGPVAAFSGLHPTEPLDLGDGLRLGPTAAVGASRARRGRATLVPAPLAGVHPYVPDRMPTPRVPCSALGLTVPDEVTEVPLPDPHLVSGNPEAVVYRKPGGRRVGAYPFEVVPSFDFDLWAEGDERVEVIERSGGYVHIRDDRQSWILDGWVLESTVYDAPMGEGLGGRMGYGSGSGSRRVCLRGGPLYVVDGQRGAWVVGELAPTADMGRLGIDKHTGLLRIHGPESILLHPGPPGRSGWTFAVDPAQVGDCPAGS